MRRFLLVCALLPALARADVKTGRAKLLAGDVAGAEAEAKVAPGDDGKVLLAEVYRATGRLPEARAILEEVGKKSPKHLRARAQLGLVYRDLGETALAAKVWNRFYDEQEAQKIDDSKAENLLYLAIAARNLEDFQGANETLRDAVAKDPKLVEANLEWGWMFIEKYDAADAETSFDAVLKIDPKHAEAHAGMARVRIEQNYDYKAAEAEIVKALEANPRQPQALRLRAELAIDNGEHDAAAKILDDVLSRNPRDLDALTLKAAIAWLKDDTAGYEALRKRVFAAHSAYARFFHVIAEIGVRIHRYKEAIALEEEALKVDPKYHPALAAIGTGYLRLGDEARGLKALEEAHRRDKFNVRTYNILNLFEDIIPQRYEMIAPSRTFRFRVAKDEKVMIERYLPRLLDKAYADMVKRYGFTPQTPITIELFNDPDHYSVRTVGLPNLGALGVCFGPVITALSPSNGNVNWGMVLWHELGHVFAIQMSNSRVPRWFTEGLSEVETILARREWRRENDADIWQAFVKNQLPSVVDLNSRFLRAEDMGDMVVAYHLSSVTMEFIVRRFGFPKVSEGLRLFGKGKTTAEVITAITGLSVADFDRELGKYLDQRLAVYRGSFQVDLQAYADLRAFEKAAAARPTDPDALADLALSYLATEHPEKAEETAALALSLAATNKKALWAIAALALLKGDAATARARLGELIAAGGDGYGVRMRLGVAAIKAGDLKDAEAQWQKAKLLDPERSEPSIKLYELYSQTNREEQALVELERYVLIEQMEYAPVKKLIDKYAARKAWAKVREFGEMALYINPYDADLHVSLGDAYAATGSPEDAAYEYDSALLSDPPLRRPAVAHLGLARARLAKKDPSGARKAVAEALRLEPDNAEALELAKKVGK